MNKETLRKEMYQCLDTADVKGFEQFVKQYLEICDEQTASEELTMFLVTEYTSSKAELLFRNIVG